MTDTERIAALVAENAELRRRMQAALLRLSRNATRVRTILTVAAVPVGTTLATLQTENKELRKRIAQAISRLVATSAARLILDIPSISAEFKMSGSISANLKRSQ